MSSNSVSGRAYAQSEKYITSELLQLSAKYGTPSGKFGKIGEPVTLTVGYQPYWTAAWVSSVNKQAKIWAKYLPQGSNIIWIRATSGPVVNQRLYNGKNQLGYMADSPGLSAGELVPCDMIAATGYDIGETCSLCVCSDLLDRRIVRKPIDLDKQRISTAIGSYAHRYILTWSDLHQVNPKLLSHQSNKHQMYALKKQNVWASATWEPFAQWLEIQGVARRWVTGQDMACTCKRYFPEVTHNFRGVCAVIGIHDWLRERPDIIVAYLKAEEECRDMLVHAPDLAAYHIWRDIPELPAAAVRASIDMMVWDGRINAKMKEHLEGCAKIWKDQGLLKESRSQNTSKYVQEWADDRFLQYAIAEMKAQGQWTSDELPGFPLAVHPNQLKRHSWEDYKEAKLTLKPWQPTMLETT
jgi:NitT/TauT family transport system substrate-binding protein